MKNLLKIGTILLPFTIVFSSYSAPQSVMQNDDWSKLGEVLANQRVVNFEMDYTDAIIEGFTANEFIEDFKDLGKDWSAHLKETREVYSKEGRIGTFTNLMSDSLKELADYLGKRIRYSTK